MAIGRFGGDAVIARFGRPATLWWASLVAGAGMTLAVLAPAPGVAIAAYFVLGLGVATIVPIAFTLAGTQPGVPPAWAISRVTTLGYAGLFASPPMVGLVAQATSLTAALAIPAVLLLLVAPLSRAGSRGRGQVALVLEVGGVGARDDDRVRLPGLRVERGDALVDWGAHGLERADARAREDAVRTFHGQPLGRRGEE